MKQLLLVWLSFVCISAAGYAQGLQGRTFVYGEDVRLSAPLEIAQDDQRPLADILKEKLNGTGIDYRITERHVLLYRQAQPSASAVKHNLHGYITDHESGETLIGANVYCPALNVGAVTNAFGFYSLPMAAGRHSLVVSYVGYTPQVFTIDLQSNLVYNVDMQPARLLGEVVVESDRPETGSSSTRMGASTISIQHIQQLPAMLGEADVLKSVQLLPGVQSGFAGTSQLSVRGGNLDQNLFLLDGIMLYNVHHVLGFESAFMPDAVKHVDFFRGSFPARYGGRLSSVVDVRTKDGDMQHYHGLLSVGLLTSHVELEGPIIKDRTSFMVSARRSYFDWLYKLAMKIDTPNNDDLSVYFYDLNVKVNHKFSDTDRLYVSFYQGQDGFKVGAKFGDWDSSEADRSYGNFYGDIHWGNTFGSLRWNHLYSPSLFSNLTIGYNSYRLLNDCRLHYYDYSDNVLSTENYFSSKFKSGIDDLMALYDFDWHPSYQHHVKFGGSYTLHNFHPEVQQTRVKFRDGETNMDNNYKLDNSDMQGHEYALYAEDDVTLAERWQLNAGLRGVLYGVDGKVYSGLEPRLSAAYRLGDGLRLKSAYTMMHQYVLQLTTSPLNMPTDLWVSVTKDHKPMLSNQWSIGISCDRWQGWDFTLEGYYKDMRHVIEYIDGTSFSGSSKGWDTKVTQGNGRGFGMEIGVQRNMGRATGMLSYTLSKTDRRFPDGTINNGKRYPYEFDHRHVCHLLLQYQLTPHVDLNACWNYSSGGYATLSKQTSVYVFPQSNDNGYFGEPTKSEDDYYSSRNNYHMKSRHQLDLSINIHHDTKHGERIWNFSLMNAYMHRNQDLLWSEPATYKERVPDGHGGYTEESYPVRRIVQATVIPILPSASYTYKF